MLATDPDGDAGAEPSRRSVPVNMTAMPWDRVLIQGTDFKARNWMAPFGTRAAFFNTVHELGRHLKGEGRKAVIFRYMNSQGSFRADALWTLYIVWTALSASIRGIDLFLILHNIDRETNDRWPLLTTIRRSFLKRMAKAVFVTDPFFKEQFFPGQSRFRAITFGAKTGGSVRPETLEALKEFRIQHDQVALCLGASGGKYRHFMRLDRLIEDARSEGISLGIVVSEGTAFSGPHFLKVNEPNIDEAAIEREIDFIYRINDDVSMPYTLYAAATAGIPVVTARDAFTYEIVRKYGLGFSEQEWFAASEAERTALKDSLACFATRGDWDSLAAEMMAAVK